MAKNNLKTFIGALPIIAKAIGRRYGVNVTIGGNGAYTDGKTINLPALAADDPEVEVLVNGYLDHEAAHCRFTDFDAQRSKDDFTNWVENALEDIRIEDLMGRLYPGCRKHLAALQEKLIHDGDEAPLGSDAPENAVLSAYMLRRLRFEVLGQASTEALALQASERFEEIFPKGLATKLTTMMAKVTETRSTQEVIDLAARIVALLKDESEEPEEPEDSQESKGSGGQDDNQGGGSPQAGDGSQDGSGGNDSGQGSEADRRKALANALQGDAKDLAKDQGQKVADKLGRHADPKAATIAEADDASGGGGAGHGSGSLGFGATIDESMVRQASARLRSRLAGLIQTETLAQTSRGRSGRRIDRRMLPRLNHGDPRMFRVELEGEEVDTAVTVLLDRSGSMNGRELKIAREASLAVTYALDEIQGVNPSAFAFPGAGGSKHQVQTLHRRGQRVQADQFGISAAGGTPLTEAAWFAGWDLLCANEPRKILIVVTDGGPDDPRGAQDVMSRLRSDGIETLGIGIANKIASALIPESRTIRGVEELSSALFEMLERKLVSHLAA